MPDRIQRIPDTAMLNMNLDQPIAITHGNIADHDESAFRAFAQPSFSAVA